MTNYKFKITDIEGNISFARVRTINEAQANALVAQNFPDRETVERIARLPKNQELSLEL